MIIYQACALIASISCALVAWYREAHGDWRWLPELYFAAAALAFSATIGGILWLAFKA